LIFPFPLSLFKPNKLAIGFQEPPSLVGFAGGLGILEVDGLFGGESPGLLRLNKSQIVKV
jgi:hypothetical protein